MLTMAERTSFFGLGPLHEIVSTDGAQCNLEINEGNICGTRVEMCKAEEMVLR
jgi:hypothetical protein